MDATVLIASLYGTGRTTFAESALTRSVVANPFLFNALQAWPSHDQEPRAGGDEPRRKNRPAPDRLILPTRAGAAKNAPRPAKPERGAIHGHIPLKSGYLLSCTRSCNISSAVVITRALDWNPR